MRAHRRAAIAALIGGSMILAACGDDTPTVDEPAEPAAESPASGPTSGEVAVTALDYEFEAPDEVAAGETTITFENAGQEDHELALGELLDGKTIDDVNALLEKGPPSQPPPWFRDVGHTFAKSGQDGKPIEVDLEAGTYVMLCFVPAEDDGTPHALLGMVEDFTVA